jgi:hypothetical protein
MSYVTKREAIGRLIAAGYHSVAAELKQWRNALGEDGGWDGWFRGKWPELVNIVWRTKERQAQMVVEQFDNWNLSYAAADGALKALGYTGREIDRMLFIEPVEYQDGNAFKEA